LPRAPSVEGVDTDGNILQCSNRARGGAGLGSSPQHAPSRTEPRRYLSEHTPLYLLGPRFTAGADFLGAGSYLAQPRRRQRRKTRRATAWAAFQARPGPIERLKIELFSKPKAKAVDVGFQEMDPIWSLDPVSKLLARFLKDEAGATAIEYALIASGISIVILAAVQGIGTTLNTTFGTVQTALK
jgi:pilus assembly protein Flp/PilA